MASKKILVNLDLNGNQLITALLEGRTTAPTTNLSAGRIYYNTTDNVVSYYNGTAWSPLATISQISALQSLINTNITDIATNVTDIAQNTSDIENNISEIAAIKTSLATKQDEDDVNAIMGSLQLIYSSSTHYISLEDTNGNVISEFDASEFIKDAFLSDVALVTATTSNPLTINGSSVTTGTYLHFTFNTADAGGTGVANDIYLNIADLVVLYNAGHGITLTGQTISLKLDPATESFLTGGASGLKLSGVQTAIDTAKTAALTGSATYVNTKLNNYVTYEVVNVTSAVNTRAISVFTSSPPVSVKCYFGGNEVTCYVAWDNSTSTITVSWNGTLGITSSSPLTIVVGYIGNGIAV